MIESFERFRVLGPCPKQGLVPTHAVLTPRQFAKLKGPLHYWCAGCRSAHCSGVESMQHAKHEAHAKVPTAYARPPGRPPNEGLTAPADLSA